MAVLILFAFLAGIVTILSPCILPMLPIILSGSVGSGKSRPLGIISGFVFSFTLFTLTLSAIVTALGISPDILRWTAAVFILLFAAVMIIPALKTKFMALVSGLTSRANKNRSVNGEQKGYFSGAVLGFSLGLVWTPCVGPIMASVISLALSQTIDAGSVFIALAYSLGTALSMFLIMTGGRKLLNKVPFFTKNSEKIQKVFGVLMLLASVALFTGFDRTFQSWILKVFPSYGSGLTALEENESVKQALSRHSGTEQTVMMEDQPDPLTLYSGEWLNSEPLTLEGLKGKVVLMDFWTYSCINCIRTIPYLKAWHEKYSDTGLVIVGVHSPEFAFEQSPDNLEKAVNDFGIEYPVVQDNEFGIWNAFSNRFWPAHYLYDKSGKLVDMHFGEEKYEETEILIQKLLDETGNLAAGDITPAMSDTQNRSPETYLGYKRAKGFASPENPQADLSSEYSFPESLAANNWALSGRWKISGESAETGGDSSILYNFTGRDVYLVINPLSAETVKASVTFNGQKVTSAEAENGIINLKENRLYHLFSDENAVQGQLEVTFDGPAALFAFTFG